MMKTLPEYYWPSGDYQNVALIAVEDDVIARWFGGPLLSGIEEGLGYWVACGGRLDRSGVLVELVRYCESPSPNAFVVRCEHGVDKNGVFDEIVSELDITFDQIVWRG